jgi:Putative zinc-finger
MGRGNLLTKILGRGVERQSGRRWTCPSSTRIAAYVEHSLSDPERSRINRHLASCPYCRGLVSDTVKELQTTDVLEPPAELLERARVHVLSKSKRRVWEWVPVTAAGVLATAVIVVIALAPPQKLTIPERPSPAAPILSEPKPTKPVTPSERETIRGLESPENAPSFLFPRPDSVVPGNQLELRWVSVRGSLYYRIRILTTDGDLVWEGNSTVTHIQLPTRVSLKAGKYFALASAMLKDGRTAKSTPVEFRVEGSE